jgi:chemotaxis protein CheC
MAGAILSVPAIHYANISDKIIFIEDEFSSQEENAISHILMIPDVESLQKIMTNLGIEI